MSAGPRAKHGCKAPGCRARIDLSRLMCPPHWGAVPADLRRAVLTAWKAYQRAERGEDLQLVLDAAEALRRAQRAAIDAVAAGGAS